MNLTLLKHQIGAVEKLESGSVLVGGVGSGKSITSMAYFFVRLCGGGYVEGDGTVKLGKMSAPMDLYVITTAKKRDSREWEADAELFGLSGTPDHRWNNVKITVDSWNNIAKYEEVKNAFFIFDEQRLVGSGAWVKSFYKITKKQKNPWILLSATPADTWLDYIPVFVANGLYKNKTEFINTHVVYDAYAKFPKVKRYLETSKLERNRRLVTVRMPYEKHTTRHVINVKVGYDEALLNRVVKDRWHVYEERPLNDIAELIGVARRVVNSSEERRDACRKLLGNLRRPIVYYNFNYELEILRELAADSGKAYAEWNGHKHENIPDADDWIYLVQYTAGAEGWNCISTDSMVFYSLNYSYRITEQSKGRIDRLNTPFSDLNYYSLRSNSVIDVAILKALRQKRNFNKKDFEDGTLVHNS